MEKYFEREDQSEGASQQNLQQHAAIFFIDSVCVSLLKSSADMDTESEQLRKIFVGGLNWETTEEGLHDYFSKWGTIVDCVIMKKNGRSRGFGFVTFDKAKCVDDILKCGTKHELDDREIEPKRSVPRDEASNPTALSKTKKIFVGGLPSTTTEQDIHDYFTGLCEKFESGKVVDIDLKKDRNNVTRLRGFAFVTFDDEDVVEKVCAMRYHEIRMKSCEVKKAESQAAIRKKQEQDDLARGITRERDRSPSNLNGMNMSGRKTTSFYKLVGG